MSEQVKSLISAIEAGKSTEILSTFNSIMDEKILSAIEARKEQIAQNILSQPEVETSDDVE
jgi:hypothetical protein